MSDPAPAAVPVRLADRSYEVVVGAGALASLGERMRALLPGARRVLVLRDLGVPDAQVGHATASLDSAGFGVSETDLRPSERAKSLETLEIVLAAAARAGLTRSDCIVALGGGVVGDIAGYAAASYMRGVGVAQCPTTLLAMVDASVGGKTGVNLSVGGRLLKNLVGAFWQPRLVLADVRTLASLPDRHLRAGLAECVKHALVVEDRDPAHMQRVTTLAPKALARDDAALADLVAANVAIKASIVEGDEREEATADAGRAALNLGHTFAHAIETIDALSPTRESADAPLLHGEAVGLGLIAAAHCSVALGLLDDGARVREAVAAAGLPVAVAGLPDDHELLERMQADKKASAGALRIVALRSGGGVELVPGPDPAALRAGWASIRAEG
ncbi:MAG: 3-dehydroquinate synthase family protein [Phycisphaerales bacterium]